MTRLLMLVEGQSEEIFVNRTLKPYLARYDVFATPILLWTKRAASGGGQRGGVSTWGKIRKNLLPLTGDSNAWVTTLLDFYEFPDDLPGFSDTIRTMEPRKQAELLQDKIREEMNYPRLIPFLALHEFEAWLFTSPQIVAEHFGQDKLEAKISKAVQNAGGPEFINHGERTHPKALLREFTHADYKETADGPTLIDKIGIPAIKAACPHFASWLTKLETLGAA